MKKKTGIDISLAQYTDILIKFHSFIHSLKGVIKLFIFDREQLVFTVTVKKGFLIGTSLLGKPFLCMVKPGRENHFYLVNLHRYIKFHLDFFLTIV